jgi:hypothetical protein
MDRHLPATPILWEGESPGALPMGFLSARMAGKGNGQKPLWANVSPAPFPVPPSKDWSPSLVVDLPTLVGLLRVETPGRHSTELNDWEGKWEPLIEI